MASADVRFGSKQTFAVQQAITSGSNTDCVFRHVR